MTIPELTVTAATVYPYYMNNTDYYLYFEYDNLTPPSGIPNTNTWYVLNVYSENGKNVAIINNLNNAIGSAFLVDWDFNSNNNTFHFTLGIRTSGNMGANSDNTYIEFEFLINYKNPLDPKAPEYKMIVNVPIIYGTYSPPTITNISPPNTTSENPDSIIYGDNVNISFTITQDDAYNTTNIYDSNSQANKSIQIKTLINQYIYIGIIGGLSPGQGTTLTTMNLGWESTNSNQANSTITIQNVTSSPTGIYYVGWNVSTSVEAAINLNSSALLDEGVSNTPYFYYQVIDPTPTCNPYSTSIYPNRTFNFNLPVSGPEGINYNWQIYNIVGGGTYTPSSGYQEFYSSKPLISFTTPNMSITTNTAAYDASNSYSAAGNNNIQFTIDEYSQPSISVTNTTYYLYTGQTIDISVNVNVDSNITTASTNNNEVELSGNINTQGTYGTLTVPSFSKTQISNSQINVSDLQYTAYQIPNTDSVSFFYIDTFNQSVTTNSGYTSYQKLTMNIKSGTPLVNTNSTMTSYPNRDVSFSITSTVPSLNGFYPPYMDYSFNPNTNISPQSNQAPLNDENNNYSGNFSFILPGINYNTLNSYDTSYIVTNPEGNNDNSGNISFTITPYTTPTYDSSLPTYTVLAGETLSIPFKVTMSQGISSAGTNYNQAVLTGTIYTNPTLGSAVLNTQTYNPFPSTSPIIYDISYIAGTTLGSDSFTFNIQDTFNKDVTDSSGNTGNITLNINIKNPTQVSNMSIDCSENIGTNNSTSQAYIDLSANDGSGFYPLSMIIKTVPLNGKLYYKSNSDSSFNWVTQGGITIGQMTDANTYNYELYYQGNLYYYGLDSFTWYAIDNVGLSSSIATNTISIQYVNVPPTAISYDVSLVSYYNITDISKGTPVELLYSAVNRSLSDLSFTLQSYSSDISYVTLTKELITYYPYTLPEVNLSDTGGYEKNNVGVIDNTLVDLDKDYGFTFNITDPSGATSNTASVGVYIIPYLEDTGVEVIENGSENIYLNTEYTYLTNNGIGYTFSYYIASNVSHGKLTYNGSVITSSTSPFITTKLIDNSESNSGLPIVYTANKNYAGNDSFTWYISYTNINDGYTATSNTATVTINIPEYEYPPVAENKTYNIKLK
jgi:hypothetical protein